MKLYLQQHRISIRSRIALAIFGASALVLMIMSVAVYFAFERNLQAGLNEDLETRATSYASLVDVSNGSASLRLVVDPRRERAEGEALVRLFDPNGRLIEDGSPASGNSAGEAALVQRSSSASTEVVRTLSYADGERFRVLAVPVNESGQVKAILITGLETSIVDSPLAVLRAILFVAVPATSLALAYSSFFIVRRGLRPVVTITESARRIAAGDLHERIGGVEVGDEVGELASTFNDMIERLAETVERERRFTADVAHELRTPLAAIETSLDVTLVSSRSAQEYRKTLETVQSQARRLDRLMRQLLLLSTLDVATFQLSMDTLDLGELVEGVSRSFADDHPEATVIFEGGGSPVNAKGHEELLARAFGNVLENAVIHGSPAATIRVSVRTVAGSALVVIADDGPGIGTDLAATAFHRFRRGETARSRGGTGLGLAIVDSIVRVHHGSLRLLPAAAGTVLEFSLPLSGDPKPRP